MFNGRVVGFKGVQMEVERMGCGPSVTSPFLLVLLLPPPSREWVSPMSRPSFLILHDLNKSQVINLHSSIIKIICN